MSTAKISEPISDDKLDQERARTALPLLVRQAQAGVPVFYSDLAEELGMPQPSQSQLYAWVARAVTGAPI